MSKEGIKDRIHKDWGREPQSRICLAIFEYLLCNKTKPFLHLTYGSLRKVVGTSYTDCELLTAIQYLCGERIHLLEAKFELIDRDNYIDISKSELNLARATGKLVHPESGEAISDFEERVYIYFQPSPLVKTLV